MAATVITPLSFDEGFVVGQRTARETSGQRGIPEMDFDILNEIQFQSRSRLGTLQTQQQAEHEDLSTILEGVNLFVKDAHKRKRDSDLMFTSQADELTVKSEEIRQKAMEATADPFNELKALFGDTKSMAEWAAMHNSVQNELSMVKRRYTATAAGYNFDMDEAAMNIQFAQQKLAMTKENIANITAASQAVTTQIQTQSAMFTQQLNTMHSRKELQAELDDPKGTIPKDLVRRRLQLLDLAKADLAKVRATKGKSQIELATQLAKFVTTYPELVSEDAVNESLRTNKSVMLPLLGVPITPQIAKTIQPKQAERAQLDAKLISEMTTNRLQGQQAFTQVVGIFQRASEPGGTAILGRDAEGKALPFDPSSLPEDMKQDAAIMFDLRDKALRLQNALAVPGLIIGESREQAQLVQNEWNREVSELRNKIAETASVDAQSRVAGKQAKVSAGNFAKLGLVKSDPGAYQLLAEGSAGVISGNTGLISTAHGAGWGDGVVVMGAEYKTQWQSMIDSSGDLFIEDGGEIDSKKLIAAMLAGNIKGTEAGVLAMQKALDKVDPDGHNIIQVAILSDMYEILMNRAVRELEDRHAAEPETVAMLELLRFGVVALDPKITTMKDKDGITLDPMNVLIASLALEENALREAGTLPKDSILVHEFKSLLLGDESSFGNPNARISIYQLPEIRSMMKPVTQEGAALHWLLFRNRIHATVQTGLQNITKAVPIEGLDRSMQLNRNIKIVQSSDYAQLPGVERNRIAAELIELRKAEGDQSLTAIMKQILDSQE